MSDCSDTTQKILASNQAFYQAFESLRIEEMAKIWHQGPSITCIHPGWKKLVGWDPIRASFEGIFSNTDMIQFLVTEEQVHAGESLAWVTCLENIVGKSGSGEPFTTIQATNIFRQIDDRWLMVMHHASSYLSGLTVE
ncbi:MAG: nuclear transport factor 2 family protein [Planctomycetota bacterium]|nr:nuclear transport factor 2 family protein [Planctomycetota bacterium]